MPWTEASGRGGLIPELIGRNGLGEINAAAIAGHRQ